MQHLRNSKLSRGILGVVVLGIMILLVACGGGNSSSGNNSDSTSAKGATATPDANHTSLAKMMGNPTAKVTTGTNVEVTGQVKNVDTKQHDVKLKATLTNASGQVVGTATGLADNIPGGGTEDYTLKGTLTQPTWSNVSVVITKVTENVDGKGGD